jgi:hypothetical protein
MNARHRPHQIVIRVTTDSNEKLRLIAKHYRMPISKVAREMMALGYREWLDRRGAGQ